MSREYTRRIATLGNVPTHGPFIYFDDFENLLQWTKHEGVGDSIFELDPTIAYSKNQSLLIETRTTNAAIGDRIGARRDLYMLPSKKLNASIHFFLPNTIKITSLDFYFSYDDYAGERRPEILFLPNTPIWQYVDAAGNPQNITGSAHPLALSTWHRVQLLADCNINKFIALIIDDKYFDLSAFTFFSNEVPNPLALQMIFAIKTSTASPCRAYLDDALIHEL